MGVAPLFLNLFFQLDNLLILGNDNGVTGVCTFDEVPQFIIVHRSVKCECVPRTWFVQGSCPMTLTLLNLTCHLTYHVM